MTALINIPDLLTMTDEQIIKHVEANTDAVWFIDDSKAQIDGCDEIDIVIHFTADTGTQDLDEYGFNSIKYALNVATFKVELVHEEGEVLRTITTDLLDDVIIRAFEAEGYETDEN